MRNRTKKIYVRDFFKVFKFLNQYSSGKARDEIIFLLIVDLFEGVRGIKAIRITKFLMKGDFITQADKNRTWQTGIRLIKNGSLTSPKVGYYNTTPLGRDRSIRILREIEIHDEEFNFRYV